MTAPDSKLVDRRHLYLPKELFNEAAKPPYQHLFAMTDLGNMLFEAFKKAGLNPLFRSDGDRGFKGIDVDVLNGQVLADLLARAATSACHAEELAASLEELLRELEGWGCDGAAVHRAYAVLGKLGD